MAKIIALLSSHNQGDEEQFLSIALQVAANVAVGRLLTSCGASWMPRARTSRRGPHVKRPVAGRTMLPGRGHRLTLRGPFLPELGYINR
jgi:hypothetical protein